MKPTPEWSLCTGCGRDKKGHDHLNRLVLPADRHTWETPQTLRARVSQDRVQPSLIPPPERQP